MFGKFILPLLFTALKLVACQNQCSTRQGPLPVNIKLSPYQRHYGDTYVETGVTLVVAAEVATEKSGNVDNLTYNWSTKEGPLKTDPKASVLNYKFDEPSDDQFLRVEVTRQLEGNVTEKGSCQINLLVKDRVYVQNLIGKLFLEHGDLLNIKIQFNGSSPINYCYKFCYDNTSHFPCDFCFPAYSTDAKELIISSKYLHHIGNYTLMVSLSNVIGKEVKRYRIRIDETTREQKLPFAPIISSILAVLILLTGVTLHLKCRKTTYTETADFDFIRQGQEEEEWEEEQSFIQRVKYLFCRGDRDDYYSERQRLLRKNSYAPRNTVISYVK